MIEHTDPLPRVSLGGESELQSLDGYMDAQEFLEHLIAIWWGADLSFFEIEIEGHQMTAESRLGRAAATGLTMECARVVQKAGESGEIRGLLPHDPADPLTADLRDLKRHDWSACDSECKLDLLASDLMTGVVSRINGQWLFKHNGKPLFFECSRTEAWLRELCSPHLLRQPLFADPATLPARPYVTFSEAVSWLVYGKVMSSDELDAKRLADRRHVVRYAEDEDEEGETEIEFGEWFAPYLAALVRLEVVHRILRDAMERGKLGTKEQNGDAHLSGANLQGVQFARYDLERLGGSGTPEELAAVGSAALAAPRPPGAPGRRNLGEVAAKVYRRVFPDGHEQLENSWESALDEIANHGAPKVSKRTLQRGLKTLRQKEI